MFKLANIRDTAVWKEAHEEGKEETQRNVVRKLVAKGKSAKEIADLLDLPLRDVRRLAKAASK